jgi:hypothetical protein
MLLSREMDAGRSVLNPKTRQMDAEGPPPIPSLPRNLTVAEVVYPMTERQRDALLATLQQLYDESADGASPAQDIKDLLTILKAVPQEGEVYRLGLTKEDSGFMMATLPTGTLRRQLLTIRTEPDKVNGGRRRRKTRKARRKSRKTRKQ